VPRVGLQLYTVRAESARDPEQTLRAVAEMGYEGVEIFDLMGVDAQRVRGWLDERGLAVAGRHTRLETIETELDELVEEAGVLGTRRLVVAWVEPPETSAEALAMARRMTDAARLVAEQGLQFGFHNHAGELRELDGGRSFLEELREAESELIFLELDLGWAWEAGADPIELLERMRGRCPLVHVKDFRARGERAFCPVGDGAVGYERVLPAAVRAGVEWLLVEQDEIDGPALDAVERSLRAVRRMLEEGS
jgi:sugar phosphate isomerase/epimerase